MPIGRDLNPLKIEFSISLALAVIYILRSFGETNRSQNRFFWPSFEKEILAQKKNLFFKEKIADKVV
ncbi:MAG: hypothetical protein A2007_04950 [Verrucomicrobia bacterium GWC2_42_7]|nr:MAG: hypothetical protein A2007_04950 [Verrucomicrobia bacterium GWC2_42_7]